MHIPDGFLDAKTVAITTTITIAVMASNTRNIRNAFKHQPVPFMGMISALVFTAQMLNFPITIGVSGHLLGSALVTALFGPAIGMFIMAVVVALQAFLFNDGGVIVLGANVLNMAVIGCWVAYFIQQFSSKDRFRPVLWFLSGWFSIVLASFTASIELGLSGIVPFNVVVWPMLIWHSGIGVVEGIITAVAVPFLLRLKTTSWKGQEEVNL